MLQLNGIFPPIPTPFDRYGNLATEKINENLNHLDQFDLAGYLVLGSNGEMVMLTHNEQLDVFKMARKAIPENKVMLAGTGCQSTRQTIELTNKAADIGADAALILNPYYYKGSITAKALVNHYYKVADASKIPVVIYNMPANTGIDMDAETILQISQHPNIIGIKDSAGNIVKLASIVRSCDDEFRVLAGSAGFLLPALSIGASGGITALANIAPQQCIDLYRKFLDGRMMEAGSLQLNLIRLNIAVTSKWGLPAMKEAMDMIGLYGGPVREPLLVLEREEKNQLRQLLRENGLLND
ncbi:MAG: dihydrodipicolinate synthase family protein [Bacteroidales bacterium]|nr:MAG: dihydrodipicolinate synthase family protein [Bacteroidales bacterium]